MCPVTRAICRRSESFAPTHCVVRQVFGPAPSNHPHVNGGAREFVVEESGGERLDAYLTGRIADLSRSSIQKLIESANVSVNGSPARASYKVQPGDRISVTVPPPEPADIAPEQIALDILYEDDQIIVINKPKGMTVHPAPGSTHGTLVNAILAHSDDLSGIAISGILSTSATARARVRALMTSCTT